MSHVGNKLFVFNNSLIQFMTDTVEAISPFHILLIKPNLVCLLNQTFKTHAKREKTLRVVYYLIYHLIF